MDGPDRLSLCKLLVERNICCWVPLDEVVQVGNQPILNGLFGVGKGTFLESGDEVLRLIMNLKPSNSVLKQIHGATDDLPSVCQYLSVVLQKSEQLELFQSDMSSAFYLFRLPSSWARFLSFNIGFRGDEIGLASGQQFQLGCQAIPMGWGSAVAIMQEVADRLTRLGKLPLTHQVRRSAPLPLWIVDCVEKGATEKRAWYHVCLDNFCSMQKTETPGVDREGEWLHLELEKSWEAAGVLSSAKKRVSRALRGQELGADVNGQDGVIGPSNERLLKLLQSTMVVLSKPILRRKWVQVIAGRWVHIMSFRRPGMIFFDAVWKIISKDDGGTLLELKARAELFGVCFGALLLRTNLKAALSATTTASDASSTGGAVGKSTELTAEGRSFAAADLAGISGGRQVPVLVLSLFNGIGCCFRCYDLIGVIPKIAISYETNPDANRVTSRRWPAVQIYKDVKTLTIDVMREWRSLYPDLEEVHVWAGFPCSDLCSAKWGRENLKGQASGLFFEVVRILKQLRQVFGFSFVIKYGAENVASMDREAEGEITSTLGVKPLRFDPWDAVPIHRPRFCWTNVELSPMEGADLQEKDRWIEVSLPHAYPAVEQWLEEGAWWPGGEEGHVLPTAMKAIKRARPPPKPAGLERVSFDSVQRWEADQYRFPPYQYSEQFIIWVGDKWRLVSAEERELLHGLGFGHTKLCWNASAIKGDPQGFEDARKSLVGDSFSCYSFCYLAAMMCSKYQRIPSYDAGVLLPTGTILSTSAGVVLWFHRVWTEYWGYA